MSFDALYSLTSISPDLDLAVLTTSVTPAFLVEANACEESCSVSASHNTGLLQSLGYIGRVPEDNLLGRNSSKSQVVSSL